MQTARMTVLMEPAQKAALESRAAALHMSASELVRRAVEAYEPEAEDADLAALVRQLVAVTAAINADLARMEAAFDRVDDLPRIRAEERARVLAELGLGA